jgi:hypothetical protein
VAWIRRKVTGFLKKYEETVIAVATHPIHSATVVSGADDESED